MPIFTFEGFTEGSLVALSAAQGAQGSVSEWRLSNMNTATLDIATIEPAELVAPVGIWFEATDLQGFAVSEPGPGEGPYDPTAHDITYIWDFDDPGTFGAHLNVPTAWNNSNIDYGKKAYHVFETPGTYVLRLWAIDREGVTGERMVSITVLDPNDVYGGNRTICVSGDSDFTGAPSGSNNVTSIAAARTALAALNQTGRILLRRGEEFSGNFNIGDDLDNAHIGVFGPSEDTRPIWRPVGSPTSAGSGISAIGKNTPIDVTIWGIDFRGEWDATLETGDSRQEAISVGGFNGVGNWSMVVFQCRIDGFGTFSPVQASTSSRVAVVDCEITNHRSYGLGVFAAMDADTRRLALVGTSLMQSENACAGRPTVGRKLSNEYACLRYGGLHELIISCCSFYSALSQGFQQALRLAAEGSGNPGGQFIGANRMVVEGGVHCFKVGGQDSATPDRPGNFIFDMCLLVGDYHTREAVRQQYGGVTVRNTIAVLPNTTLIEGGRVTAFRLLRENTNAANNNAKWQFYNNTVLNLSSNSWTAVGDTSGLTDYTYQNNVNHQPSLGSPITSDGPFDLTQSIAGFATRNRGRRLSPEKISQSVSVTNGNSFTVSYSSGLSAGSYNASGRHTVSFGEFSNQYFSYRGDFTVSFGGSNITVTNTSGATWSGTVEIAFERADLTTDTDYVSPSTLPLPVPGATSSALTAEGDLLAYTQFGTALRTVPRGAV